MDEPRWVSELVVLIMHTGQLREHGGLSGLRDAGALASALSRPRSPWAYAHDTDLATQAACYGLGVARSHPLNDGIKRVAFLAMVVFLELNQHQLRVTQRDAVEQVLALAAGALSEEALAAWVRAHLHRV